MAPSSRPAPKVAVLLHRDQDASAWRERHARGETMDVTPYGYERATDRFDLTWSTSLPESSIVRTLRMRLGAVFGFDIVHAWRNRRMLFGADLIWTHTEREHLAVALLQRLRRRRNRVPVLAQSVWLWDAWSGWGRIRRRFVAWLLCTHAVEAVHSRLNLERSRTDVPGRNVVLVPFGSAAVTREAGEPSVPPLVLVVGNDADRDWATLADALRHMGDIVVRIASKSAAARQPAWPSGTTVAPTSSLAELADLYRKASVVVVPLRQNLHASGATSCIEALAARRRLVVTDAGGLADYVDDAARLVPVGDSAALASAIGLALADDTGAGRDPWVERGLTQRDYIERYVLLSRWILDGGEMPRAVSAFEAVKG